MTALSDEIALKLRDYVIDGDSGSGDYDVDIADLRSILTDIALVDYTISSVQSFVLAASTAAALTAIGLGTGDSPTFAGLTLGSLAVDTTTLVVDPTNNRVGIGTASPLYTLDVSGGAIAATTLLVTSILRPTSDGSDNSSITVAAASSAATSRSGVITVAGNEASGTGNVGIYAGDIAGAAVVICGPGATDLNYRGGVGIYGGGVSDTTSARVSAYGGTHASSAGTLYLNSGSTGPVLIYPQTSDGSDNRYSLLAGGGTSTSARGAYAFVYGNEHASAGIALVVGGDVADGGVRLYGAGATDANYRGYSVVFGGVSTGTGASVIAYGNAHGSLPGDLWLRSGSTGNAYLVPATSDGSDSRAASIGGGGTISSSRGAYAQVFGNENGSSPGKAVIVGGDVADGGVQLRGAGSVDGTYRGVSAIYGGISQATGGYLLAYGNAHATQAGQAILSSGTGDLYLLVGTSDGADSRAVYLAAGSTVYATRGGVIGIYGNEHASFPGQVTIASGLAGNVEIVTGTSDTADNRYVRLAGGGGFSGTRGAMLFLYGNENPSAGNAYLGSGEAGNVTIYNATASASDTRQIILAAHGGAAADPSRGGYIVISGINHASVGRVTIAPATGGYVAMGGITKPTVDNTYTLGDASLRWSVIYAGTGTINTSDITEKLWRGAMNDNEYKVASRIANGIGVFQWLSAVASKGEAGARLHVGVTAQSVQMAFAAEGLDSARYGAWCIDAITHEDGTTSTRQGLRFDQLAMFMIAAGLKKIDALEAAVANHATRLADLEAA